MKVSIASTVFQSSLSLGKLEQCLASYFVFLLLSLNVCQCSVSAFAYSFPNCVNGPLKNNAVCDPTKDSVTRAKAVIQLFTVEELINNTVNTSPGIPRLGLPNYEWWSEALVSLDYDFLLP
jgi:hypothetical protein